MPHQIMLDLYVESSSIIVTRKLRQKMGLPNDLCCYQPGCCFQLSPLWNAMRSCFNRSSSFCAMPHQIMLDLYVESSSIIVTSYFPPRSARGLREEGHALLLCLSSCTSFFHIFLLRSSLFLGYVVFVFGFISSVTLTLSKS